jgi:hypothetical protein
MAQLRQWLLSNGAVPDENPNFPDPDGYSPDAHSSAEHREGRAFDVNFSAPGTTQGRGVYEATDPVYGPKMDKIQTALKAAGWNVVWRSKNHFDHLHVYHRRGL